MIDRCQGHARNPYSFDQYIRYIYPGWSCHLHAQQNNNTANTTLADHMTTSTNDKVNALPPLTED